jgi:hypothetical protein
MPETFKFSFGGEDNAPKPNSVFSIAASSKSTPASAFTFNNTSSRIQDKTEKVESDEDPLDAYMKEIGKDAAHQEAVEGTK